MNHDGTPALENYEPPTRWELELEFVQSLANPQYLNFLAQNKMLESADFLKYLEYLEYWRLPENSQYIIYPNCLHILSLLRQPAFRQDIASADVAKLVMDDYYMKWLNTNENGHKGQGDDQKRLNGDVHDSSEGALDKTNDLRVAPSSNGTQ